MPRYTVEVKTVEFTHIALDKTNFDAKVRVSYQWIRSATLTDIKYRLYVKNKKVGEGKCPGNFLLGKKVDTVLSIPCTIKTKDISLSLVGNLLKGAFDYTVKIYVKAKAGIHKKRITIKYSGTANLW